MNSVTTNDGGVYTNVPGNSPGVTIAYRPRFERVAPTWRQWLMGATGEWVMKFAVTYTTSNVHLEMAE